MKIVAGQISDPCDLMEKECWAQCGKPLIFPFRESCRMATDLGIYECYSPPGCTCYIPEYLRSSANYYPHPTECLVRQCTSYDWTRLDIGWIKWCQACGYDCNGNQRACLDNSRFCQNSGPCAELQICARWRQQACSQGLYNNQTCDASTISITTTMPPTAQPTALSPTDLSTPSPTVRLTPSPTTSSPTSSPTIHQTPSPTLKPTPILSPVMTTSASPTSKPTGPVQPTSKPTEASPEQEATSDKVYNVMRYVAISFIICLSLVGGLNQCYGFYLKIKARPVSRGLSNFRTSDDDIESRYYELKAWEDRMVKAICDKNPSLDRADIKARLRHERHKSIPLKTFKSKLDAVPQEELSDESLVGRRSPMGLSFGQTSSSRGTGPTGLSSDKLICPKDKPVGDCESSSD